MSKELSKELKIIILRNGVEIALEGDKIKNIEMILSKLDKHIFIRVEGRTINTADLTGVFYPKDVEELVRRRNGQWKCGISGRWHPRGQEGLVEHEECLREELSRLGKND